MINKKNICGICKIGEGDGSEYPTCWDCKVKMGFTGEAVLTKQMNQWINESGALLSYSEMDQDEYNKFIKIIITRLQKLIK